MLITRSYLMRLLPALSLAFLVMNAVAPPAEAVPITVPVWSTFDAGLDGWICSVGNAQCSWASTGGNPGGYFRFTDKVNDGGWMIAPSIYRGDWSGLDGMGRITYDHKIIRPGGFSAIHPYQIVLFGDVNQANRAVWTGETPAGEVTGWVPQNALLDVFLPEWEVTDGNWADLLTNVTGLWIRLEMFSSTSPSDIEGVDNVHLVPEPSTALLLASGLAAMAVGRRR